jgi:hypothetical protein
MAEIIQGVSYKVVAINPESGVNAFELVPKDANGNVFNEVTLECDTFYEHIKIILPEIATLNGNWNISVKIINIGSTVFRVSVEAFGGELIGSGIDVRLDNPNSNVILTPVSSTVWSAILTA